MKKGFLYLLAAGAITAGYLYSANDEFRTNINSLLNIDEKHEHGSITEDEEEQKDVIPPREPKKIVSPGRFHAIDQHAINTPSNVEKDIRALCEYLVIPAKNDLEKTRAIFTWIAKNVSYDDTGYNSGNYIRKDYSPAGVFKSREAVCEGYSNLFLAMCDSVGLKATKIIGYAKGYSYAEGSGFKQTNHAWNAVKIDDEWRLFDATWASGYGENQNGRMKTVMKFDDYWFDVDPKEFIFSHFPENMAWQLNTKKISLREYVHMPYLGPGFFKLGFDADYVFNKAENREILQFVSAYPVDYPLTVKKVPYTKQIGPDHTYNFEIEAPYAEKIALVNNSEWIYFEKEGSIFRLTFAPKKGTMSLNVRHHSWDPNYSSFAIYQVEKGVS